MWATELQANIPARCNVVSSKYYLYQCLREHPAPEQMGINQVSWGASNLVGVSMPIIQQRPDIKIISKTMPWSIGEATVLESTLQKPLCKEDPMKPYMLIRVLNTPRTIKPKKWWERSGGSGVVQQRTLSDFRLRNKHIYFFHMTIMQNDY